MVPLKPQSPTVQGHGFCAIRQLGFSRPSRRNAASVDPGRIAGLVDRSWAGEQTVVLPGVPLVASPATRVGLASGAEHQLEPVRDRCCRCESAEQRLDVGLNLLRRDRGLVTANHLAVPANEELGEVSFHFVRAQCLWPRSLHVAIKWAARRTEVARCLGAQIDK